MTRRDQPQRAVLEFPRRRVMNYLQGDSQILLKRSLEASKPKQRELVVNFFGS